MIVEVPDWKTPSLSPSAPSMFDSGIIAFYQQFYGSVFSYMLNPQLVWVLWYALSAFVTYRVQMWYIARGYLVVEQLRCPHLRNYHLSALNFPLVVRWCMFPVMYLIDLYVCTSICAFDFVLMVWRVSLDCCMVWYLVFRDIVVKWPYIILMLVVFLCCAGLFEVCYLLVCSVAFILPFVLRSALEEFKTHLHLTHKCILKRVVVENRLYFHPRNSFSYMFYVVLYGFALATRFKYFDISYSRVAMFLYTICAVSYVYLFVPSLNSLRPQSGDRKSVV